ncbi:hypothetical protein, partial [Desulfobotulus sp.]|uniref:hypothetical protein n=1 Tax=Desulfobotulus sp. TaxID=1940337 RepID=UPI002A35BE1F
GFSLFEWLQSKKLLHQTSGMLQQYLKKVFFVFGLMVLANFASDTGSPWENRGKKESDYHEPSPIYHEPSAIYHEPSAMRTFNQGN